MTDPEDWYKPEKPVKRYGLSAEPIKGAKFPLFLTDAEWTQLIRLLHDLPNEKWQPIIPIYTSLKEQLEKMGYKL